MVSLSLFKAVVVIQYSGDSHANAIITVKTVHTHRNTEPLFSFILHAFPEAIGIVSPR
jgi:hypothetical protein